MELTTLPYSAEVNEKVELYLSFPPSLHGLFYSEIFPVTHYMKILNILCGHFTAFAWLRVGSTYSK